jgi:dTDP-4-dehydrorhamnose 3,5-epimerase
MRVLNPELSGLKIVELDVHGDARGFFVERFREDKFKALGLPTSFVQDNHSRSAPGVLRGLHFQTRPLQGKLVGVARGKIWDVAVDVRKGSPTFGKHFGLELSDTNGRLLWIPSGFAHGFCVLGSEPADVVYKVDALYEPSTDAGIFWNDPALQLPWPIESPVISGRDQNLPTLAQWAATHGGGL